MLIGELWGDFLKDAPRIAAKISEARLPEYWTEIVGEAVNSYTTGMNLHRGILYISFSSPIIRHEVLIRRESLKKELNEKAGMNLVNAIIVK